MVTTPHIRKMTVEEFDQFVLLPENAAKHFEFIGGEIVEMTSNNLSAIVAARIIIIVGGYILLHDLGWVTPTDGGYQIGNERYSPDFGFVAKGKQPKPRLDTYIPIPPDLVVEVLSPSNSDEEMRIKTQHYLSVGAVVWVVDPLKQRVEIYLTGEAPKLLGVGDIIDGGSVLPGFTLPVKDIFPE